METAKTWLRMALKADNTKVIRATSQRRAGFEERERG
jgi:hypothetical protein